MPLLSKVEWEWAFQLEKNQFWFWELVVPGLVVVGTSVGAWVGAWVVRAWVVGGWVPSDCVVGGWVGACVVGTWVGACCDVGAWVGAPIVKSRMRNNIATMIF